MCMMLKYLIFPYTNDTSRIVTLDLVIKWSHKNPICLQTSNFSKHFISHIKMKTIQLSYKMYYNVCF